MWEIEQKSLQNGEVIEFVDEPSLMSCILAYVWLAFMILPSIAMLFSPETRFMVFIYLAMASPAIYVILVRMSTKYGITNRGLVTRTGIITTNVKSVPYKFVTSTEIKETIIGKMFNYANVIIDTAGSGKNIEANWRYLRSAHKVKKLIDSKITPTV